MSKIQYVDSNLYYERSSKTNVNRFIYKKSLFERDTINGRSK